MVSYLILCRSLTHAQRTVRVLERSGIKGHIIRTPRSIAGDGCGYSVRITDRNPENAVQLLRSEGLGPKQVYEQSSDGSFGEVVV